MVNNIHVQTHICYFLSWLCYYVIWTQYIIMTLSVTKLFYIVNYTKVYVNTTLSLSTESINKAILITIYNTILLFNTLHMVLWKEVATTWWGEVWVSSDNCHIVSCSSLSTIQWHRNMSSRFSSKSEAKASDLVENLEEMTKWVFCTMALWLL